MSRTSSAPVFADSTVSLPSGSLLSRLFHSDDEIETHSTSSPGSAWANEYSSTDILGRIGTFWPRDLLPLDFRNVRICTLGYKSQWTTSKFHTSFKECGEHLLTVLERARGSRNAQSRPIIFIAHSFGGLVVQSALVRALTDDRFSMISSSAAGCLFLGTPFQGKHQAGCMILHLTGFDGKQAPMLLLS